MKKKTCCSCQCGKPDKLTKFQDYFLRGTYVFCSCLIVYSLLMINGLVASDPNLKSENLLAISYKQKATAESKLSMLPNPKEVWMDTVFFMDRVGYNMGEPLNDSIHLYSKTLTRTFVATGNALAGVTNVLTGSPPYVSAQGY